MPVTATLAQVLGAHARAMPDAPFTTVMLEKPKLKMRSDMDLAVGPMANFQI